jgi:hypothetical protein
LRHVRRRPREAGETGRGFRKEGAGDIYCSGGPRRGVGRVEFNDGALEGVPVGLAFGIKERDRRVDVKGAGVVVGCLAGRSVARRRAGGAGHL